MKLLIKQIQKKNLKKKYYNINSINTNKIILLSLMKIKRNLKKLKVLQKIQISINLLNLMILNNYQKKHTYLKILLIIMEQNIDG